MFAHNFKYTLKTLLKNKALIFWTFAFPLILGAFFKMAFNDIEDSEKMPIIPIAIVDNDEFKQNKIFEETFKALSKEGDNKLFTIQYVDEEKASSLLASEDISGYLIIEDTPKVVINQNGGNETVFKYVVDEIMQQEKMLENNVFASISSGANPEEIYESAMNKMQEVSNMEVSTKDISSSNLSYTMIEYYTLIAMACLYGGILGMSSLNNVLPNMSQKGKRVAISPIPKRNIILSSVLASFLVQLLGLFILFMFTIFVIKADFGSNLPLIILLALVGSFAGLALGIFISSVFKVSENLKTGISISVTMLGCFLSGMMGITMKYIVDKNVPIINKLNPASMITDGFYALYYYDTLDRYWLNIISLLIFAIILILISYGFLRRQKYDSI